MDPTATDRDVRGGDSARTLRTMRRLALVAATAVLLVACSTDPEPPPVIARDVTGITNPAITAPDDPVASTSIPPIPPTPLEYSIEWTPVNDRVDEGRITVPVDYANPQGDTIDLYVVG